jgi:hypothetical protein
LIAGREKSLKERFFMNDILLIVGVMAVWFVVARWVLPALGVPT